MTRRVLCVSPRFPPLNGADCHRLRLLLPYLRENGWEADVLAVDPRDVDTPADAWLESRLPAHVGVHRVRAPKLPAWGLKGLAQRCLLPMYRAGNALLARQRYDAVFFSTTEFLLHVLGPAWQRRFGIPFGMDLQDPWVTDYYERNPNVVPPGGRVKFALKRAIDQFAERAVVRRCSGFMAVSPAYLKDLDHRYGNAAASRPSLVAQFPAEPGEFAGVAVEHTPGPRVWRYIGRAVDHMALPATAFFRAWRQAIDDGTVGAGAIRFEAIGTAYAGRAAEQRPTLQPLAHAEGVGEQVTETPARVGYSDMLSLLQSSDALVVFGSDDPDYSPSKIYPYLLSGKRVLVICHAGSPAMEVVRRVGGAVCVGFDASTPVDSLAQEIRQSWFVQGSTPPFRPEAFADYTARNQARQVCAWLEAIVANDAKRAAAT